MNITIEQKLQKSWNTSQSWQRHEVSLKAGSKQTEIPEVVETGVISLEDGDGVALVVEVVAGTSREREKPVSPLFDVPLYDASYQVLA